MPHRRAAGLALAALLCGCSTPDHVGGGPAERGAPLAPDAGADAGDAPAEDAGGARDERSFVVHGARVAGEAAPRLLVVEDGRLVAPGSGSLSERPRLELDGRVLAPAFIDAHVHLAYLPAERALLARGVAGAVDLASPLERLGAFDTPAYAPLRVLAAGPMITAVGGYPTRGWGRDGYGLECADAAAAVAAVDRVYAAGARLVKVAVGTPPELDETALAAVVTRAHALGLKVAAHALTNAAAARAARAGADLLAHTPVEPLAPEVVALWAARAVVSTLGAFGGGDGAVANLAALRAAGARVLYGTDLGNTSDAGIDARELALLARAGLDGRAILRAGTETPARYFGFEGLGDLGAGRAASFLVLDRDPEADPSALAAPEAVYIDGRRTGGR